MIDLVGLNIEKAKAGDREAAKALINEFCATIRNSRDSNGKQLVFSLGAETYSHTVFNESLLKYFEECFTLLTSGKDDEGKRISADVALNLSVKGKRGNPPQSSTRANQLIRGMQAWESYKNMYGESKMPIIYKGNLPPNIENAFNVIAKKDNVSIHTVAQAYEEFQKLLNQGQGEVLELLELTKINGK